MLPTPVSVSNSTRREYQYRDRRRRSRSLLLLDSRPTFRSLFTRSRLTNLAVLLLATFGCVSFIYNLAVIFSDSTPFTPPKSILDTIQRNETLQNLSHLILVPGHAIWSGSQPEHALDEDFWTLQDYQKGGGTLSALVDHLRRGASMATEDEHSLLVFSGGQTRLQSTTTEAESYMRLALTLDLFHTSTPASPPLPFPRATTETSALDSYQNLLFSIARFHQVTGRYPSQITVVGYQMKQRRFEELHRTAIRFPAPLFHYIGLQPPATGDQLATARQGEFKNGYQPYTLDLYGCHDFLLSKRRARNPFIRFHSYHASAPELRGLIEWCPDDPKQIYQGPLPWDVLR
ncbi:hypothetical protein BS17DRAFT_716987 [Gyrodon lividus]|nr:hypothetical protein BS17DRAFT_716987 [Gyrodon lividus]